jgi:hypothetical protein
MAGTTVFSLSSNLPAAFPANEDSKTEFDTGVLTGPCGQYRCLIRRFNAVGATLGVGVVPPINMPMTLELMNGLSIDGTLSWCTGEEAGFVFDSPTDVVGTLARRLASLPAERRSVPRVELHQMVSIRHGDEVDFARTRDLSQTGVGLQTRLQLQPDDRVQITFDGLRPLDGTVRWAQQGWAGIGFDSELGWQTLMPWLRQAQKTVLQESAAPAARYGETLDEFGLGSDREAIHVNAAARVREGVRWWNVQLRSVTPDRVEFETAAQFPNGTQLWVWLPQIGGRPARLTDQSRNRFVCEFRLPLRRDEFQLLGDLRRAS